MTEIPHNIIKAQKVSNLILFSISFASFMVNLDTYIVNISLPSITSSFNTTAGEVSWVALSYNLTVASLLIIFGKLGDKLGLKKVFLSGLSIFTISSLLCGLSPSLHCLIGARFLQGIGASILYAMTPAMVPKYLPENMRGPAFGTLATAAALGIIIGTPLGGLLTGYLSWHWIFYINILPGIAAIIVCNHIIPDDEKSWRKNTETFDFPGSFLSFFASLTFIYGLNMGHELGWTSFTIGGSFFIAVLSIIIFILWEYRTSDPLVELNLFKNSGFTWGNIAGFFASNFLSGHNFLMPFYLTLILKLSPQEAGIIYMVYSAIYMITGPLTGKFSTSENSAMLSTVSMIAGSISTFIFAFFISSKSFTSVIIYFISLGIVYGIFITANNNLVIGMAPEGKHGIVSGIFRMTGRLGMASGVCIFETIFSSGFDTNNYSSISSNFLVNGFYIAYMSGGLIFMLTAICSIIPVLHKNVIKQNEVIK
ncbi:MAG: MFS transporter [Candidatus Eremiobacterota bacterium]